MSARWILPLVTASLVIAADAGAQGGIERGIRRPVTVHALESKRDVRIASGDFVRAQLRIECTNGRPHLLINLTYIWPVTRGEQAPLSGVLLLLAPVDDSLVVRSREEVVWPADATGMAYSIPDSSNWTRRLAGVAEVAFLPYPGGPFRDRVDFDAVKLLAALHDATATCAPPSAPEAISKVAPVYPQAARDQHIQGLVILRVFVDREGRVAEAQVQRSIPELDEAAISSVLQWRFRPAQVDGQPIAVWMMIPIRFSLN